MLQERYLGSVKIQSVDYNALMGTLKRIAAIIKITHPHVKKVYLFGSFSKGNYTPESDVDVLIIVKHTDMPFLQRGDSFLDPFKDVPFDVNILVYTEDEIKMMQKREYPFIRQITNEALEL